LSAVSLLLWLLSLPLAIAVLLDLDPIVGSVVPEFGVIRVPLILVCPWAGRFALPRWGAIQPRS
jgi:hypothetical protein